MVLSGSISRSMGVPLLFSTFVHVWAGWHMSKHILPLFLHGQLFFAVHREQHVQNVVSANALLLFLYGEVQKHIS